MNSVLSYTSATDIKKYWTSTIAPQYFNLDNINNYNIGIFGYINEIMANTTEDGFNAITTARREFYPVTAQFTSSLYAMATLQSISIPLTTPATCKCALIIPQSEIIDNSTFRNGLYECTIDSCLKIFAGDLQFMLDYPIKIISKKTADTWTHTIHYDINISNSLNTTSDDRYLSNIIMKEDGINYLVMFIDCIRQLSMTEISSIVVKDNVLDTITMDIDFDGKLANFEIFYKENSNSNELQLAKVMLNATTPTIPYAQYEFINTNKIRLTFAYNSIFTPKYNSEIICRIYTSNGSDGNFNSFSEDLVCSSDSEKYPYNANMTILGKVNGSATGGADQAITEEFRNTILKAYSTNNTITTSHDLQLQFDDISDDISDVKVLFKKKRDDPFIRLFGAYTLMKDDKKNIVPTNTLNMEVLRSDFTDDLSDSSTRITIPPGMVFTYKNDSSYTLVPARNNDNSLKTLLDVKQENNPNSIYFTNPFLIGINLNPNNVGYYMSSIDKYMSIEYSYVNDNSMQQFIGSAVHVYRNSISRSNYYKFTINITPASTIDPSELITVSDDSNPDNTIRAEQNGIVISDELYYDDETNTCYVRYGIQYENSSIIYIKGSNTLPIGKSSEPGYKMKFSVGDTFVKNDILAVSRCTDLGKLIICGDLNYMLYNNDYYMAFSIQDYNAELNSYELCAYLGTNDVIDLSEKITFTNGIYDKSGDEVRSIALPMNKVFIEMNVLYNNSENNILNKYSEFTGLENFTLTNTYISTENDKFDFIGGCKYIRSVCDFLPGGIKDGDYTITISESPVISALWGSDLDNYNYFISKYYNINAHLNNAYYSLENNFNIDSKFYNTYGKARFYKVGNNIDTMYDLDSVKCSFRFGISLNTVSSTEQFIVNFREFIRDYIESDINITTNGQDIYIMNLISEIKSKFSEITYIEYYGINSYDYMAQKIVGPTLTDFQNEFIPEFLNLDMLYDANGEPYPNISVRILS